MTSATAIHPVDLEPSLVAYRTYATRRRIGRIDTTAMLSIVICLLYLLPGQLIVPELTFAGRPALLVALGLLCWWAVTRLHPRLAMTGPQPIRWVILAYLVATLMSYLAGLHRGLLTQEANAQDFALLLVLEFVGVAILAADGIPNWQRLYGVLRTLVWGAGFMAAVGLLQSFLHIDVAQYLVVPGLQLGDQLTGFAERGAPGQFRVAGTATHYIEFSAVLAIVVPFAIHFARFAPERGQRRAAAVVALMCTAAIPVAISRTGIVALLAALLVMIPVWKWRFRYNMIFLLVGVTVLLFMVRPGLLGTIQALFAGSGEDPSVQGRTDDYSFVGRWFAERPWFGRGPNTLIPTLYQGIVLDNQWLYTLVTGGLVGVAAFAALHITGIWLAGLALRRAARPEDRHLCAALIAAMIVSMLVAGTVDSLYFTTFAVTTFLLLGVCGAVWRFTHPARTVRTSAVRAFLP